jgi:hypothetical protein
MRLAWDLLLIIVEMGMLGIETYAAFYINSLRTKLEQEGKYAEGR